MWTGAGISSCLDLALPWLPTTSENQQRWARPGNWSCTSSAPGGQGHCSVPLEPVSTTRRLEDFRHHISQNIATPFTLTEHAHVSERQLAQIFRTELGTAPATYLESARVEAARNRLGSTNDTLERVASACGFKTTDTLIRAL